MRNGHPHMNTHNSFTIACSAALPRIAFLALMALMALSTVAAAQGYPS